MKILIAGTGDTAVHLAKMLSRENQDVVVMGTAADTLAYLDSGYNVITALGKVDSVNDQKMAGVPYCDLFIAVSSSGNDNVVAAEIAKILGAGTTIARIDNPEFLSKQMQIKLKGLGIDKLVFPEYLAAKEIVSSITHVWADSMYHLSDGALDLCSIKLRDGASIIGMSLVDFGLNVKNVHVSLIKRGSEIVIPRGSTRFMKNDEVYFSFLPDNGSLLTSLCGKSDSQIKNVMIAGAGKIAEMLVDMLPSAVNVKVIDPDREKCRHLALRHSNVTVINADYRDNDVLREEGIRDNCAFVALGDSSEANIVIATVAKHIGAIKTIAQIEDIQYFEEVRALDIDTVINKKLITSSRIYQALLDNYLDSPRCLAFEDSEVSEIIVAENAPITRHRVKDLKLPSEMTIAGLIRNGEGMLVTGNTIIEPADHVMVFCRYGSLKKVRKEFGS